MAEFVLLGSVGVRVGDEVVDLGPTKRRAVLAALLVDVGRPVSVETLIDRVWDEAPPAKVRNVLYGHVARIRRTLEAVAVDSGEHPGPVVRRRSGGYVLEADRDSVDMHRFSHLLQQARSQGRPDERQAAWLREAIDLWQGVPLAGLPGGWAARMRESLEQQWLGAVTLWARTESRLGRQAVVVDRLHEAVARYPLAESLVGELMRALALDGRAAEALGWYAKTRRGLADELGTEPGPELRQLHEAVLRGTLSRPTQDAVPHPGPTPAQLPADVPAFTGRTAELAELSERLITSRQTPNTVVISAVSGTAGVGKTALAVRWAHQARGEFPDGQLYVNLRGYDARKPVPPADALAGFLSALGVTGRDMPLDVEGRSARYRTELQGRRMLIVLDNAASAEQVRPLLPGTPTCKVVVTSRDSLAGLVAVHGAHRLSLDMLPPHDALSLLRTLIGARVDGEPEAAAVLADRCGRLPLALRVAAELAASRPDATLTELGAELGDHRRRLELLDADGDPRAAVRSVFSWSYQRLPAEAARLFRLLGLHPGPGFDAYAGAALSGEPPATARRTLDLLARAHLIQPVGTGRYAMHDLLRLYAAWQADSQDSEPDRRAALTRLFDYYLAATGTAIDVLHLSERHQRPHHTTTTATPLPPISEVSEARTWLDTEHPTLTAVCAATAATPEWDTHTVCMAVTLHRHLENGGHFTEALTIYTHAEEAARRREDQRGQADVLTNLGVIHRRLARYDAAIAHHKRALDLARQIGHRASEASNLTNLGVIHELQGQYRSAVGHHEHAVTLFREISDRAGEAIALNNLGIIHELLSEYDASADHHRRALALCQELGHTAGEAAALGNLGIVHAQLGDHATAADHYRKALTLFRRLGHRSGEAHALTNLGDIHTRLGQYETAVNHHHQALELFRRTGERYGETGSLNGLGETLYGSGRLDEAIAAHTAALALAEEINEREEQARAHIGLARIHQTADPPRPEHSREHWLQALTLYTALGCGPEAADVQKQLAAIDQAIESSGHRGGDA